MNTPLRGLVMLVWIGVYVLMMWHADWPWSSGSIWNFGAPGSVTLDLSGAMVPVHASWQRFLLSPWLQRSLVGLVLYLLFWSGTASQMIAIAGKARTWILFVAGGAAGATAHLLSFPEATSPIGAGPFDAIAALVGAALCWGLFSRSVDAPRVRNGALVTVVLVGLFSWWAGRGSDGSSDISAMIGLQAMLGGFAAGFLLMALFGPRRVGTPAGPWVRRLAGALVVVVLAAGISQGATLLASTHRGAASTFLDRLQSAEYAAWDLSRDQVHATDAKRADLARALGRLLQDDFLTGAEGEDALRAYAEALRAYTVPVPLPWVAEAACRKAFRHWYESYEKELREQMGIEARMPARLYWKQP